MIFQDSLQSTVRNFVSKLVIFSIWAYRWSLLKFSSHAMVFIFFTVTQRWLILRYINALKYCLILGQYFMPSVLWKSRPVTVVRQSIVTTNTLTVLYLSLVILVVIKPVCVLLDGTPFSQQLIVSVDSWWVRLPHILNIIKCIGIEYSLHLLVSFIVKITFYVLLNWTLILKYSVHHGWLFI
jgi:hypothetical protein